MLSPILTDAGIFIHKLRRRHRLLRPLPMFVSSPTNILRRPEGTSYIARLKG